MTHRPPHRLTGKVALVTGGGSGVDRATASTFAREGATVTVAGPEPEDLDQTVKFIRQAGGRASVIIISACNIGVHSRLPGFDADAASKAALSALTRSAARKYICEGIRINAISPGGAGTEESCSAEDTASAATFDPQRRTSRTPNGSAGRRV